MLNKIKKQIIPMLDTLGEALKYYTESPSESMFENICFFLDSISIEIVSEDVEIVLLSDNIKSSLDTLDLEQIYYDYQKYCESIEDIPVQYKVVFLPYYENTWDSLESVYEVFSADPMFITEIVIIPILRNTPTGFIHIYHDYLTPMGISNTHYDNYDFEIDLPDIVFFNQPYDELNYDKFKSSKIKPYTGLLAYIPYTLYRHEYIEKEKKHKNMEIWAELPGHINADIIVSQGDSFTRTFSKSIKNGYKIITLGNPKSDFLWKHSKNNDWPRYELWENVVNGKHTFLLNTHYTSFYESVWFNETASTSSWIKHLFNIIINDEELALIWRPHPQTFLLVDAFYGDNKKIYEECIDATNICNRIILDKTPSVVSSIMYADAVISENSSIISESICLNKPVFLVGVDPREFQAEKMNYYDEQYRSILEITHNYIDDLVLHSAIPSCGLKSFLHTGESIEEFMYHIPLEDFIYDIKKGNDPKAEKRYEYRKQLLSNLEGHCGTAILKHIKSLIYSR